MGGSFDPKGAGLSGDVEVSTGTGAAGPTVGIDDNDDNGFDQVVVGLGAADVQ